MKTGILRRAIVRLRHSAGVCLPALALALALGTVVVTPPPDGKPPVVVTLPPDSSAPVKPPIAIPQVNWNS